MPFTAHTLSPSLSLSLSFSLSFRQPDARITIVRRKVCVPNLAGQFREFIEKISAARTLRNAHQVFTQPSTSIFGSTLAFATTTCRRVQSVYPLYRYTPIQRYVRVWIPVYFFYSSPSSYPVFERAPHSRANPREYIYISRARALIQRMTARIQAYPLLGYSYNPLG